MKTIQQIKTIYENIVTAEYLNEKDRNIARKKAGKLIKAILILESGITEAGLIKQKEGVKKTLEILDLRFHPVQGVSGKLQRAAWQKENGYAKMKKSLAEINWILRL